MTDRSVIFAGRRKGRRDGRRARSATVNRGPDRERRRQAILQAARQVFARKGYEPATLEAVAREAGLAKGTLYLYFRDKEDLYFHTVQCTCWRACRTRSWSRSERLGGRPGQAAGHRPGQFDFFVRHRDTLQLFAPFSNPGLARLHKRLIGRHDGKVGRPPPAHHRPGGGRPARGGHAPGHRRAAHRPGLHRHGQPGCPSPGALAALAKSAAATAVRRPMSRRSRRS